MKLYIYEHCPFCARVAYVANALKLNVEYQVVDYADAQTLIDLIGQKMVPVLEKADGSVMAESMDIIAYFIEQAGIDAVAAPLEDTIAFQRETFSLIQKIGYPRWTKLNLKEFATEASIAAWQAKKETAELNFVRLLENTEQIVADVNAQLVKAEALIQPNAGKSPLPLVDQAIYFSLLRSFFVEPTVTWPQELKLWLETNSNELGASILTV
ncbi:glutaredoxin 2 [Vibrio splendidus]|uniref:glutaredoxin 2 n=1 Tax=Vibrio splendidus TaxID=29497 RepID=UPI000C81C4CA|nr:glutaredoxin 2 [Vibrio splendidus]PMP43292.1 glutaredoxin, GrxB family [Vibrio splendidus]